MSKHTVRGLAGRRLVIQPSKTTAGAVHVELLGADRQSLATFSLGVADCGMLMMALESVVQSVEYEVRKPLVEVRKMHAFEVMYGCGPLAAMAGGAE
jgi:hypothetical protein